MTLQDVCQEISRGRYYGLEPTFTQTLSSYKSQRQEYMAPAIPLLTNHVTGNEHVAKRTSPRVSFPVGAFPPKAFRPRNAAHNCALRLLAIYGSCLSSAPIGKH
ncbi:hypothetical protein BaRGS_00018999 [Batillaria attramentaria]|uniref:Uncharacterized protein n=1 Tax=Batillaria attramentaria TaxID=370345 RepID=A0ABD0KRU5_9CAEN